MKCFPNITDHHIGRQYLHVTDKETKKLRHLFKYKQFAKKMISLKLSLYCDGPSSSSVPRLLHFHGGTIYGRTGCNNENKTLYSNEKKR